MLVGLATLAACAGAEQRDLIAASSATGAPSDIAAGHEIFVVTTRAPSPDPRVGFTGARSDRASFASVEVTVPRAHELGKLEVSRGSKADPARYFTATSMSGYADSRAFEAALRADIRQRGGRALVFIHGYNTPFDSAVYRATQIAHDSGYAGTPILFSWASGGRAVDYVYDRDSALAARDALEATMRLAVKAGASRVDIVAHSMGNMLTMETFRQLAIGNDRDLGGRLGDVVLASPDIDVDVFKSQMRRYGLPKKPFFVLTSANDRALRVSSAIAGNRPRLGDNSNAADIARLGVVVVDVSDAQAGDGLNHTKFADNPVLVSLLGERLREGDTLGTTEGALSAHLGELVQGLGQSAASVARIIITTPVEVLTVAAGG